MGRRQNLQLPKVEIFRKPEKVTNAAAIGAPETCNRRALSSQLSSYQALFSFSSPLGLCFHDFCIVVAEKVVYVPKDLLLSAKMAAHPLLEVTLA